VIGLFPIPRALLLDDFSGFHVLPKTMMACPQVWEAFQSQDLCVRESEIHEDCSRAVKGVNAGDGDVCPTVMKRYACATESCQVGPKFGSSESNAPVRVWASVAVIQDLRWTVSNRQAYCVVSGFSTSQARWEGCRSARTSSRSDQVRRKA
jgi:hypothetical protein